mgnify:CR=1 FL=1
MPVPTKSHMVLHAGVNSTYTTIYTSNLIKAGDTINISGTNSNNGVFYVEEVVTTLNSGEGSGTSFTRTGTLSSGSTSVDHTADNRIVAGLSVSGTGIPASAYVASITDSDTFVLSANATATGSNVLTFADQDVYYVLKGRPITSEVLKKDTAPKLGVVSPVDKGDKLVALGDAVNSRVDVWSNSATSSYSTKDNGWKVGAVNPTTAGTGAQFIYLFVDGALRVCNINEENSSSIKWYGYIQKQQFNQPTGLVFSEWQQHPNNLAPVMHFGAGVTYSYGHSNNDNSTAANYYNTTTNRGVAVKVVSGTDLRLGTDIPANTDDVQVILETTADVNKSGRAKPGELFSFASTLGTFPKEFNLVLRESSPGLGKDVKISRAYGGALSGTAPFDFDNHDTPIHSRGVGWNIGVSVGTGNGEWGEAGGANYEFYQTFIYDSNQESLPIRYGDGTSSGTFFLENVEANSALKVAVYADLAYNGRISGGRIYIRRKNTDEDLILLADIDIQKGVRTTIDGDHVAWGYQDGKGYYVLSSDEGNSRTINLDSYSSINGFSPDVRFLGIGGVGEMYKASVVSNRRAWVANVKVKRGSGDLKKFGDRIMYSEINKFDTFLEDNYIDVSTGDYGDYVAIESFADRLLAYKQSLVHVINISSPSPSGWYLEETLKYVGAYNNYSVTRTKYGIAWLSDDGCYLYDGRQVTNLLDKRLAVSDPSFEQSYITNEVWNDWFRGSSISKDAIIGYDPISNSLIMFRSPNDGTLISDRGFIYDFDSESWTTTKNIFTDSSLYTNFVRDFNNNLTIGVYDGSSDVEFKKFLPVKLAKSGQYFITKDIDFGEPSLTKKIYKIIVTYKSSGSATTPFSYSVDGKHNFSGDGGGTLTGNFSDTSDKWDVLVATPSSAISCQSIQLRFGGSGETFEINDISIEYRTLRAKKVS